MGKTKSRSGRKTKKTLLRSRQAARSEEGVDVTLIHWMLSLTPIERLKFAQENSRAILRLRRANPKLSRHTSKATKKTD